ncbi:MAG: hypothetical protein HY319_03095 [Armatimonadetes bacterium]|nr:hypothetical protein [Armatimonadota bacterium]
MNKSRKNDPRTSDIAEPRQNRALQQRQLELFEAFAISQSAVKATLTLNRLHGLHP